MGQGSGQSHRLAPAERSELLRLVRSGETYRAAARVVGCSSKSVQRMLAKTGGIKPRFGLFQGMFEKSILTFKPGWDQTAQKLASFTDVRELQRQLKAQGVQLRPRADENTTGPASFVAVDPDGNPILVDQHE